MASSEIVIGRVMGFSALSSPRGRWTHRHGLGPSFA
jgi:hypothetical protein